MQAPKCSVLSAEGQTSTEFDARTSVCGKATGVLSCDAANAVPFDLSVPAGCQALGLSWVQGEQVRVSAGVAGSLRDTIVEWVDISGEGTPTVRARRTIEDDGTVIVPHSASLKAATVLRFLRKSSAPVSVGADALTTSQKFVLPAPAAGAELFVLLPTVTFQPASYRVVGSAGDLTLEADTRKWFRVGAIRPGAYQIVPRYLGGLSGASQSAVARADDTTFLRLPLPTTGALEITADERLCRANARIELTGAGRRAAKGTVIARDAFAFGLDADCLTRLEGLLPGGFTVSYRSEAPDVRITEPVAITAGATARLPLEYPGTVLVGRILRDGKPLDGKLELLLTPKEMSAGSGHDTSAAVEATGDFKITTDADGEYRASLRLNGSVVVGVERFVTLSHGVNTLDWDVPMGRVNVQVLNWSRSSPVQLIVRAEPTTAGAFWETQLLIGLADRLPVAVEPLGFQTYRVQAVQRASDGPRLASPIVKLTLDSASPERDVVLELQEYKTTISVTDMNRTPIPNAVVTIGGGAPLTRGSDGLFELGSADGSAGAPVTVSAPGYVPTCVVAPQTDTLEVILQTGRSGVITFVESAFELPYPPGRLMWAGLPCEVSFRRFDYRLLSGDKAVGTWVFRIDNLPGVDVVRGLWGAFDTPMTAEAVRVGDDMRVSLKRYK
ncbi:MAG: hypothetical protein WD227_12555 [Vicinamibacterales bacterium]